MFPNGEKINFKKSGVETKFQLIDIVKLRNSIVFNDGRNGRDKFIIPSKVWRNTQWLTGIDWKEKQERKSNNI